MWLNQLHAFMYVRDYLVHRGTHHHRHRILSKCDFKNSIFAYGEGRTLVACIEVSLASTMWVIEIKSCHERWWEVSLPAEPCPRS